MASQGLNPIVAVGFAYADSVKAVAAKYPNTKFAIVDDDSITAAERHAAGLRRGAGLVPGRRRRRVQEQEPATSASSAASNTPLIQKFEAGFLQGAKTASLRRSRSRTSTSPRPVTSPGSRTRRRATRRPPAEIAKGADVVYHAAGASGKGVFDAAKAGNALAIGVDSDQYNQKTVAADKDVIITSMLKRVDVAVFDYIQAVAKGDLTVLPKRFDLKVDGVGYATSGGKVDDIKDVLDGYKAQIISGAITVSDKPQK